MIFVDELLTRGYFPKELPPSFTSAHYAEVAASLSASPNADKWTEPVTLNLARPGNLRRRLSIPNPFSQQAVAQACENGWPIVEAHVGASKISLSRPSRRPHGRALVTRFNFEAVAAQKAMRMGRARFTVKSDVSDCYGSIYTHSIEWALTSKANARPISRTQPCSATDLICESETDRAVRRRAFR